MKQVLCIAESCCDIIFGQLERIPAPGEEEYCKFFSIKAGGGSNTAMGLARLRVPTRFLTRLGKDEMGRIILNCLVQSGLEPQMFQLLEDVRTPVSAVMSTVSDRCFASFGGDTSPFVTQEELEREIRMADHVHTYLGYCLTYPIAELCKKYHKTLSIDTSWLEKPDIHQVKKVLSNCSLFTPNDKEAMSITDTESVEDAIKRLSELTPNTVITLGEKGSLARIDNKLHLQKSISYGTAVDSTGAGDLFCSGLIYGFLKDLGLKRAMEIASHTSGLCVTYYGGLDDCFTYDRLQAVL